MEGSGPAAHPRAGTRWVIERTHPWVNGYGKLRRCTDRDAKVVDSYLYLAAAFVTVRQHRRRVTASSLRRRAVRRRV